MNPAFNRLMNSRLMNSMHMFTDVVGKYKRKHTHVLSSICTGHPLVYIYIYIALSLSIHIALELMFGLGARDTYIFF